MKLKHFLILIPVLRAVLALPLIFNARSKRGLLFDDGPDPIYITELTSTTSSTRNTRTTATLGTGLGGTWGEGDMVHSRTIASFVASHSIISSIGPAQTTPPHPLLFTPPSQTTSAPNASPTDSEPDPLSSWSSSSPPSPTSPSSTSSTSKPSNWKIIGIAVIAVSTVAASILSVVFFDSWSRFLLDMTCGRKNNFGGKEDLVPDWAKRSWEVKLAGHEDSHRYPSLYSSGSDLNKLTATATAAVGKQDKVMTKTDVALTNPFPIRPSPAPGLMPNPRVLVSPNAQAYLGAESPSKYSGLGIHDSPPNTPNEDSTQ